MCGGGGQPVLEGIWLAAVSREHCWPWLLVHRHVEGGWEGRAKPHHLKWWALCPLGAERGCKALRGAGPLPTTRRP